jgi:hypothetical protein
MRLINSPYLSLFKDIPLYYISVRVKFHETGTPTFEEEILNYVTESKRNSQLH